MIIQGRKSQDDGEEELKELKMKLRDTEVELRNCYKRLRGQRRRICEDLMVVYPVEPVLFFVTYHPCSHVYNGTLER